MSYYWLRKQIEWKTLDQTLFNIMLSPTLCQACAICEMIYHRVSAYRRRREACTPTSAPRVSDDLRQSPMGPGDLRRSLPADATQAERR